ncbi:twin transmembrane helix small protein [Jannaschia ovalis]|uniref:Twin transmembrane helix small protein n=1 Tax=Jannaschia ovalis TaxID=3038773 RepID=A0ABY8LGE6_9RHOB|nr:twin transmembrane helix small protein [Jannaschia sp. GRR-S6-38]WGH79190.1 twin transmembrane helix small protein [Jannaschia sp. GRR-S6-38]
MRDDPLFYLVAGACVVVLLILLTGIGGFAKGGDFNKKHANRLMRWRVIAQFIAVILLVGFVWLRSGG